MDFFCQILCFMNMMIFSFLLLLFCALVRLQCEPTQMNSSLWKSCPSMQCQGPEGLYIGNSTSSSVCNRTSCAYAGYTNQTILTSLVSDTCPGKSLVAMNLSIFVSFPSYFTSIRVYIVIKNGDSCFHFRTIFLNLDKDPFFFFFLLNSSH